MRWVVSIKVIALAAALTAACAGPSTQRASDGGSAPSSAAAPSSRTLVMAIRVEPNTIAAKSLESSNVTLGTTRRLFNANLIVFDQAGQAQPYLAAQAPQLNTET